ncbi:hypothetical protein [Paractinoplanes durhamensis]|uniref:hypothetical protein n=1 Tax=Paractinoplanes durhamensis TaxID=113563 RepID=UPI003629029C
MAGSAIYLVTVGGRIWPVVILCLAAAIVPSVARRFQVDIDHDGWSVRIGRFERRLPWDEIAAVVIENRQPGRHLVAKLFLVPVAGAGWDVPERMRASVDGRPAVDLFDLEELHYDKDQLIRELSDLTDDRLDVRIHSLAVPMLSPAARARLNAVPDPVVVDYALRPFPEGWTACGRCGGSTGGGSRCWPSGTWSAFSPRWCSRSSPPGRTSCSAWRCWRPGWPPGSGATPSSSRSSRRAATSSSTGPRSTAPSW